MFEGYRVVSVTPAGRRKYLEVLTPYLLRNRGLIDEHEWWINTHEEDDIAYLRPLAVERPEFFTMVEVNAPHPVDAGERNLRLAHFYPRCVDRGTIYLKLDDDICYVAPDAVERLLRFRLDNPHYFLTYANTINSPLNTHIHQRIGALPPTCQPVDYWAFGNAWSGSHIAAVAHETFLRDLEAERPHRWHFERWEMPQPERFSINFCAWFGRDFERFEGRVEGDDEEFLSCVVPARSGRPNAVCGRSLVAHFAFSPQRDDLEKSDLLERYRQYALLS